MKILPLMIAVLLFCFEVVPQDAGPRVLRGKVVDQTGSLIVNADIRAVSNDGRITFCQNENGGDFVCEIKFAGEFLLTVQAEGFSILRQTNDGTQDISSEIILTLQPAPLVDEVFVTANRTETRLGETAASVVSLSNQEIRTAAAPAIDDVLRQVPGFSLFRRSGSRTTNPTAQGVSLRGVGASGAGRSLILFDGIPLNDPFGGWTQWSRIPPITVERIEVLRGGASSLYGDNSLSGAVNIFPRRAEREIEFSGEIFGGTQKTISASGFLGLKRKDWSVDLTAAEFQTRGYIPVEEIVRGAADSFAGAQNSNFSARAERRIGDRASVFFKSSYFGESRRNGTDQQINRTHIRQFAAGGNFESSNQSSRLMDPKLTLLIYGGTQVFDQTFSAVSDDRNSETLVRVQRVPAQVFGINSRFSTVFAGVQTFAAGFEAKEVRGASNETGFFDGRATSQSGTGGRQRTFSFSLQDFARINARVVLTGSIRYDLWQNFRALGSLKTLSTNLAVTTVFRDRSEGALSPAGSILFQATDKISFHAVASRSFRAPTLNELYRGFRVGNVVTASNANLQAEKASNFETGAIFAGRDFYLRGNFFYTEISDPVANVTLSATSSLIVRQRQNMGRTRTAGFEFEAEKRWHDLSFSAGYLFSDSRVSEFPANPGLEGLRVPLVPLHQITVQARFAEKNGWSGALQGRASSEQFDDDQNLFRLEPYFQMDAFGAKRFSRQLLIFIGIENIFNSRYSIGRTPVRTVGSPIIGRIGIRWN